MTPNFSRIYERPGWCPNTQGVNVRTPGAKIGVDPTGVSTPDSPQPGATPASLATPHWMSAVAVAILFATIFVGGNLWWVVFVLAVLILLVILHIRSLQNQGA